MKISEASSFLSVVVAASLQAAERPNIIVVYSDDDVRTQNIDALALGGVRLLQAQQCSRVLEHGSGTR